jgi:hypothetical protein
MGHSQACPSSSRNSLKKRASAGEDIIYDHGSIPWLKRSFDEFPEPMILRLLPHHEGPPRSRWLGYESKVRDTGGNGNRSDFQPTKTVEFDRPQRFVREAGHKTARPWMGHQRPAIDVEWAL